MNLRHLRSFLVLAEDLHFGRAAKRIGIAQPSLSQQIRALEDDLGVVLLTRTSRVVELSAAGEALVEGARTICGEADRARATVRDVMDGRSGRLVVGSVGAGFNGLLVPVLRRLRLDAPDLRITLRHLPSAPRLLRQLQHGLLDLALLRGAPTLPGMRARTLFDEPFIAYLPDHHRLAHGTGDLALGDLRDEPFVLWPREVGPAYYDTVIAGCRRRGFTPTIGAEGDSLEAQLCLVAAGSGVSVQAASNATLQRAGTVVRRLRADDLRCTLDIAYIAHRNAAAVETFLDQATAAITNGPAKVSLGLRPR